MKIEIVSISDQLLMSDILDTNAAHVSRNLNEIKVTLTCKTTVGDDVEMIAHVLEGSLTRADMVITIGGLGVDEGDFTRQAIAQVIDKPYTPDFPGIAGAVVLGDVHAYMPGLLIEDEAGILFCLPGNRYEMAYLLETEVLPYIRKKLSTSYQSDWILLRTVGIMASSLKQQLEGLTLAANHRVSFDSFAGQANVRLRVEAETDEAVAAQLGQLKEQVLLQLGDHVYGEGDERLENVILELLKKGGHKLAVAECYTNQILAQTLKRTVNSQNSVVSLETSTEADLTASLHLDPVSPDGDLIRWCRTAAEQLRHQTQADLGLVIYKSVTQGGVQLLVTLASSHGVSVTNRSFGGHPEYIDQWACNLGLTHLRRWLLVHS